MPTTITSEGITFNDATTLTTANLAITDGSVTAAKLGTNEQKQIAKAWVNFDGTTNPPLIRSSYNVSSVTRTSTGFFTVNFATPMSDANYATSVNGNLGTSSQQDTAADNLSTSSFRIRCNYQSVLYNSPRFTVLVFGN